MIIPQQFEVDWYRKFGKYPERIITTPRGGTFVIGDEAWRKYHRDKPEFVEGKMREARLNGSPKHD